MEIVKRERIDNNSSDAGIWFETSEWRLLRELIYHARHGEVADVQTIKFGREIIDLIGTG